MPCTVSSRYPRILTDNAATRKPDCASSCTTSRATAAQGVQPWATLWASGHGDAWRSDAEYIEQREDRSAHALLAS